MKIHKVSEETGKVSRKPLLHDRMHLSSIDGEIINGEEIGKVKCINANTEGYRITLERDEVMRAYNWIMEYERRHNPLDTTQPRHYYDTKLLHE